MCRFGETFTDLFPSIILISLFEYCFFFVMTKKAPCFAAQQQILTQFNNYWTEQLFSSAVGPERTTRLF